MTLAEYHAHPALSRSRLWTLHESPQKFLWAQEHPEPPSPAFRLGAAFHKLALEPETFEDEYVINPGFDRRTKTGKTGYEDFLEKANGRTVLDWEEWNTVSGMVQSLQANQTARVLISKGEKEQSIFWTNPRTNLELKCRPDIYVVDGGVNIIADLKTTGQADTETFSRECIRLGYDVQAAMYTEGLKTKFPGEYTFIFIAVEKTPPYAVNVLEMDQAVVDYGRIRFEDLLIKYQECRASGNWYGYNGAEGEINKILLPKWVE